MMSIGINTIAISKIHGIDYRCIIIRITESEALNFLREADLNEISGSF